MKYSPYSFSKISCYQDCNRKFKYKYIDKIKVPINNEALVKGSKIHKILELEDFTNYNNDLEYKEIIDKFVNSDIGKDIFSKKSIKEYQIKLDSRINPCKTDHIFVGYVDRINQSDILELIDYKTGKYKELHYQSFTQLIFYTIYFFRKYTNIDKIKIRYVYVEHCLENTLELERQYLDVYLDTFKKSIIEIETSEYYLKNTKFCNWCEYKDLCDKDLT